MAAGVTADLDPPRIWTPPVQSKCNIVLNVITFGPKCNKPPKLSFNCANIEMLK